MTGLPPNRDAVLRWGIRDTLLAYMTRSSDFEVEATGGAGFTVEDGARMTGRTDADGVLRLDGAVILRAHGGALCVPLIAVRVTAETVTVDDPGTEPGDQIERVTLVDLMEADPDADGTRVFATKLSTEADSLFMYNYLPGSPFDPIRIEFAAG